MNDEALRTALSDFMAAAETKDAGKIATALARVTECQRALGDRLPPPLRHFLENRSYRKALEFMQGGTPAAGTCR
jgi:hypothetical protein